MKQEIIKYLQTDRGFTSGIALYSKYGRNANFLRLVNIRGDNPENLAALLYQLGKLIGITGAEYHKLMNTVIKIPASSKENTKLTEANEDIKVDIQSLLDKAPEQFAKSVKLRQEFPFLNETTCPDELKILVADMLTAHHAYVEAHPKLALAENAEHVNALAETVVENYLENRSIWEELNHFKEEGKILGEHHKLKELAFQKEITGLKTPELIKLKDSLYNKITRTKKQIADNAKPHLKEEREARVSEFEIQLAYVKKVLEIER